MRLRVFFGLAIPLALAAVFVRLGIWQLSRHRERTGTNAELVARLAAPVTSFGTLPRDSGAIRWRRVSLEGRFRYDLEQVQAGRANEGSPGVHLLTPLERAGTDTLVIVSRGWVYSADAGAADLGRWRERDDVSLTGYVLSLPTDGAPPPTDTLRPLRVVHRRALEARLHRPVSPAMVVMTSDSTPRIDSVPRRLTLPLVEQGPHLSYALQWFSFALIAIVGGVLLTRRSIVGTRDAG